MNAGHTDLSRRWWPWLLLAAVVAAVHLWLAGQVLPDHLGAGAGDTPVRIDVAFVTELAPAAPPAVPPRVAPVAPARAPSPAPAASEPDVTPSQALEPAAPELAMATPAEALLPLAEVLPPPALPALAELAPLGPAPAETLPAAPVSAEAPAFEWPPSTRLSYRLTGDFRGPVEGQARVEWLRSGTLYQVHLDVRVGPSFAPLMTRRASSEGEVTALGLRPERFSEETRMLLRDPRRLRVDMQDDRVRLAGGAEVPRPPGLQDTASQFVQLTWLFTTQPELLRAGQIIAMPLALPRRVQLWQYEVGESELLQTAAGPVQAVHVRPLKGVAGEAQRGGDLVPEAWFAPSLQYLPVRILIRQGDGNFIDLLIERLPQQAAPAK